MKHTNSKLNLTIVVVYMLVTAITIYFSFRLPQSSILNIAVVILTAPWSIIVILSGFLLIHLSSHGMDYGFIAGAILNTLLLFLLSKYSSRRKNENKKTSRI